MATDERKDNSQAFSLLEMMAVISFILILASFSMPIYRTIMIRTRERSGNGEREREKVSGTFFF